MTAPRANADVPLTADLNDLLQLDRDAIEAHTIAINAVRDVALRDTLVKHRSDHQRHAEQLAALIRARGGIAVELPHITGPIKMLVQAVGAATMRDANVLLSLRIVVGQVRDKYAGYAARAWPADVEPVVRGAAADVDQQYRWLADAVRAAGIGDQSLTATIGAAAETWHKMVAGPIESMAKQMMRFAEETNPFLAAMRSGIGDAPRSGIASRYRAALKALEETGDLEWMLGLFADGAVLHVPTMDGEVRGAAGVRQVFEAHRAPFDRVATTFGTSTEAPGVVTLPWTLRGTTGETTVELSGMTVLETAGEQVTKLTAYYDASKLPKAGAAAG